MTVLVGVRCSDGIVIGSDSAATLAMGAIPLLHLRSDNKIHIFQGNIVIAATGAVGLYQRLMHHIEDAIKGGVFKNLSPHDCVTNISRRVLTDFANSHVSNHPHEGLRFGALLAVAIKDEPCLVEYATTDFQPELKKDELFFVSMGSGQVLADPFLAFVSRVLWEGKMPSVEDGKYGVYWVLSHTIRLAPGGIGGPIKLAVLRKVGKEWVAEELEDPPELAEYISELETHIWNFGRAPIEEAEPEPIPQPPN